MPQGARREKKKEGGDGVGGRDAGDKERLEVEAAVEHADGERRGVAHQRQHRDHALRHPPHLPMPSVSRNRIEGGGRGEGR